MNNKNILFNQIRLKDGKFSRNRFALAPMTNVQSNVDGTIGTAELNWLLRRAQGGYGIIITCAAHVSKFGQGWLNQLGIFSDKHTIGLQQLIKSLKSYNSLNIIQLYHGGARSPSALTGTQPLSASNFRLEVPNFEVPREATKEDISNIIGDFSVATKRAVEAGFDGIEIHGANGYLFTQFISVQTNLRNDEYGKSLENRARILLDTLTACRKVAPDNFVIGVRLSPENGYGQSGLDIYENIQIAKWLEENGADYIHLSMLDAGKNAEQSPYQKVIEMFRKSLNTDTILVAAGGIDSYEKAATLADSGVDIVALGTMAIGNPDFPIKALENSTYEPLRPPYSKDYLHSILVSDAFINYLRPRPNFIL